MSNNIERRTFSVELRAADEGRSVEGYAAVYNSESNTLGWFTEVIAPGAFRDALERSPDIVALFNHDENMVLGRRSAGTLEVIEDETGLRYRIPELPKSREDVYEAIKRGDVNKSSFAFTIAPGGDKWEERDGKTVRTINKFDRIYDVSPVVYPAYSDTSVAKRSFDQWAEAQKEDADSGKDSGEEQRQAEQLKAFNEWLERTLQLRKEFL